MNYEDIIKRLEHGEHLLIKSTGFDNKYLIISPFKDMNGSFRDSGWRESPEHAEKYIGDCGGYDFERLAIVCKYWELINVFRTLSPLYEAGEKVKVSGKCEEYLKKYGNWNVGIRKMFNKKCEIKGYSHGNYEIYLPNRLGWDYIPSQFVALADLSKEIEEAIKLLEDNNILVDGKVLR